MAKICSWCAEHIGFFAIDYDLVDIGEKEHLICGKCSAKIAQAKANQTTFAKIKTAQTDPELFDYYTAAEKSPEEKKLEEAQMKEQQRVVKEARETNPLYEDIHQIAGDLRFIKNYLIFTIIAGIILGLIVACSNM